MLSEGRRESNAETFSCDKRNPSFPGTEGTRGSNQIHIGIVRINTYSTVCSNILTVL
jgi:hypothetical protein